MRRQPGDRQRRKSIDQKNELPDRGRRVYSLVRGERHRKEHASEDVGRGHSGGQRGDRDAGASGARHFSAGADTEGAGFFRNGFCSNELLSGKRLARVSIGHLAARDISSLSDGEFQKAAIATALLQQAEVILLDEPTAFLDVDSRESALCTLREVARGKHVSIIFSSHDIHTAAKYCTRVFGMQVGDERDQDMDLEDGRSLAELIDTGPECTREQRDAVFSRCFRYWGEDSEN